MIYEKATAEVILFDNSDVIRTSGGNGNGNNGCRGGENSCKGGNGHNNGNGNGNRGVSKLREKRLERGM